MSDRIRPGYHRINGIYVYYIYTRARTRAYKTHYDFAKFIPASYPMRNNLGIYDKTFKNRVIRQKQWPCTSGGNVRRQR